MNDNKDNIFADLNELSAEDDEDTGDFDVTPAFIGLLDKEGNVTVDCKASAKMLQTKKDEGYELVGIDGGFAIWMKRHDEDVNRRLVCGDCVYYDGTNMCSETNFSVSPETNICKNFKLR